MKITWEDGMLMHFKTFSSSLGHATVGFTLDTYGHVSNAMKQDAANKMEDLITHI